MALYRISVSVDPVVLIWTATFGICVAYFLLTKLGKTEPRPLPENWSLEHHRARERECVCECEYGIGALHLCNIFNESFLQIVLFFFFSFSLCLGTSAIVHTFFPSSRGSGSRASGDRRRRTSGSHERVGEGSQSQASPLARGRSGEAASQADKILGGGRIKNTDRAIIRPEIR